MSDNDMKMGITFDMNLAEQEGQRVGEAIMRGAQRSMGPLLGGAMLGNGMPTTQGPSSNEKSISGILEKILQTLDLGFGRMIETAGGGITGGGTATGKPGPGQPQTPPGQGGGGGGGQGGVNWGGIAGAVGRFPIGSAIEAVRKDFRDTSALALAQDLIGGIPGGQILSGAIGYAQNVASRRDQFLSQRMDAFRFSGEGGREHYQNLIQAPESQDIMKRFGLGRDDTFQLFKSASAYGDRSEEGTKRLMRLQGHYGLGQQGAGLMGAMVQGGSSAMTDQKLFAETLAVAIGTNLDRGRWGEAFSAMTKAAGRVQTGVVDKEQLLQTQMFVGNMGAQYKGDTASSNRASGMLADMQGGGGGPLGNIMALRAAGLGTVPGMTYQDAWMAVQRGANAVGGVQLASLVKQYANLPSVKAYLASPGSGDQRLLNRAVFVLSQLMPNYKAVDIEAMLKSMRNGVFGPSDKATKAMEGQLNHGGMPSQEVDEFWKRKDSGGMDSLQGSGVGGIGQAGEFRRTPGVIDDAETLRQGGTFAKPTQSEEDAASGASIKQIPGAGVGLASEGSSKFLSTGYGFKEHMRQWGQGGVDSRQAPGTPVFAWRDGKVTEVGEGEAGSKNYAYYVKMLDNQNMVFAQHHMDPKRKPPWIVIGARVRAGKTLLGYVAGAPRKGKGSNWIPHIHLSAGAKGEIDPETRGGDMDAVLGDQKARDDVKRNDAGPNGGYKPGDDMTEPPPDRSGSGPVSMRGGSRSGTDVNIYVYDGRVSVSKSASKRKAKGPPNSQGSEKKFG